MNGRVYIFVLLAALAWLVLGLSLLYAAACIAPQPPQMRTFCLIWLAVWPPAAGFIAGWLQGEGGFAAGARVVLLPLLLVALAWWWLLPQLWQGWLMLKCALYALAAATIFGGLSAGFKSARLRLYPPPPPPEDAE